MDNRKKGFLESRRSKKKQPQKKTEFERRQTHEEVEQELLNYARTLWGKEWIYSNLQIGRPFRMQRGINYANDEERINNLSINKGQIFATVQGTAPTPYRVKINFETIDEEDWKEIITKLSKRPFNLIELLEGDITIELIKIFEESGHSLFPNALKSLEASCSCPDKAIPCKHIASVILYLSRVIDFNPFLLLELKGKSKSELMNMLNFTSSVVNVSKEKELTSSKVLISRLNLPSISRNNLIDRGVDLSINQLNFSIQKPKKSSEFLENLDQPQNITNKAFGITIKGIYEKIMLESYRMSLY